MMQKSTQCSKFGSLIGIRVSGLSVSFGGRTVLHDINLEIADCGVHGLIGRSGSGKTTLLRSLNRLNEEFPGCRQSGRIELLYGRIASADAGPEAVNIESLPLPVLRQRVGMVFQSPNVLPVSIEKNILLPLRLVTGARGDLSGLVRENLERVGLWEECRNRLHAPAESLSGGQQQRLCLARMLALKPSILLLDEPTASLDIHSARQVEELIEQLGQSYQILMVSHSLEQARRLCSFAYMLENGRIVRQNAAELNETDLR